MFIQTEPTPNPDVLKFLPGREVSPDGGREFRDAEAAVASPLARDLFALDGVAGVYFGSDFVAVTRAEGPLGWPQLKAPILAAIMDHFTAGQPLVTGAATASIEADYDGDTLQIVTEIKDLLDSRVRPAVAQDGGDIVFDRFDPSDGTLWLQMRGACSGCPSSSATLKAGVESLMKHYVPEVTRVEQAL